MSTKFAMRVNAVMPRSVHRYMSSQIFQRQSSYMDNIRDIYPSFGLPPKTLDLITGKRAWTNLSRSVSLTLDMIE